MGFDFRNTFNSDFMGDEVSERSNAQISEGFTSQSTLLNGVLIRDTALVSGEQKQVSTKLGRDWIGYIICGKSAEADVSADLTARSALALTSTADVSVILWVF